MKKSILIIISLILILILSSCNDIYHEIVIEEIKEYNDIWSLSERRVGESSALFPESVVEEKCIDFICKHTTYDFLGTGWQVLLEIKFDDDSFLLEKERLNKLCSNSPVCGYSKYFDNLTYATVWNWNACFEYAIIDENRKIISYIYLQLIDKEDLIIDKNHIFEEYDLELTDVESYSIYEGRQ